MTQITISESGMVFGPYDEAHCFHIEKSDEYRRLGEGVKIAEFLLLRQGKDSISKILIVEAKSSSPKPENKNPLGEYLTEIREKMTNGLSLALAMILRRHSISPDELSPEFQSLDLAICTFRFVLVINGHQKAWLPPLQDALMRELRVTVKPGLWGPVLLRS